MKLTIRIAVLILGLLPNILAAQSTSEQVELGRDVLQAEKKLMVSDYLQLTGEEAKGFWPVYDAYQKELRSLGDRMLKLIQDYKDHYTNLSDEKAQALLDEVMTIQEKRLQLKKDYLPKLRAIIPTKKVVRYYQLENKMEAVVNYELGDRHSASETVNHECRV